MALEDFFDYIHESRIADSEADFEEARPRDLRELMRHCADCDADLLSKEDAVAAVSGRLSRLGEGAFGTAKLNHSKNWVVKLVRYRTSLRSIAVEAIVLRQLNEVMGIQEVVGLDLDRPMIVTRFAGDSLASWVNQRKLTRDAALFVGQELCQIVAAVHVRGFVHSDIKEDNVCLELDGEGKPLVTLIDFGLASATRSSFYVEDDVRGVALVVNFVLRDHEVPAALREALSTGRDDLVRGPRPLEALW